MFSIKHYWLGGLASALVFAVLAVLYWQGIIFNPDRALFNTVKNKPEVKKMYEAAQAAEHKIKTEPDQPARYLQAAIAWKGIGDLLQDQRFLAKSLLVFQDGIERFGQNNILFYLNAGKVAESMNDFEKAEKYYRAASTISPLDESPYLYLADLYIYKVKKSKADILAVYAEAEAKVGNKLTVVWARGTYLRNTADYAGALKEYEVLVKSFPNESGYKEIVAELKTKLKMAK